MILLVFGTRPESLKISPVCKALSARGIPFETWCLDQSPDLLDDAVLKPTHHGPREALEAHLATSKPRLVLVQGDARSTLYGALSAFEAGIPVMHIEAGLRTGRLDSPFPEEGFRKCISQIATYHACTTQHNWDNLFGEVALYRQIPGTPFDDLLVCVTGSPIVESVRERTVGLEPALLGPVPCVLLTLHRRENRGHFMDILLGVAAVPVPPVLGAGRVNTVWPAHPNGWAVAERPSGVDLKPTPPMDAVLFSAFLRHAVLVITDSGGVQEESNVLGVPCVVAREVTDRPECLYPQNPRGNCILGGNTRDGIKAAIEQALQLDRSQFDTSIYGDGKASERIADWIAEITTS